MIIKDFVGFQIFQLLGEYVLNHVNMICGLGLKINTI